MKIKNLALIVSLFVTPMLETNANVNSDLNKFFNNMNFSGMNYTKGDVWKGQAAGYLTGGGLYARTGVKNIQLASMSMPSFNAGCGGIDLYLGSFSYINSDQITRMIKAIMSNSVGYAFDLALTTLAPQLKQVKDYLQGLSQAVNDTNFSSCQAAQAMVGGIAMAATSSNSYVCNSFGNSSNAFSDWVQSSMECGVGGQTTKVTERAKKDEKWKDLSLTNINLTWEILTEKTGKAYEGDTELKQFFMTLIGTIIFDGNSQIKTSLPSIDDVNLIKAILNGGDVEMYVCDEDKLCLNPQRKTITIANNSGFQWRVKNMLLSIINKVENDDVPLTVAEMGFIESTTIPILKYIIDPMSIQTSRLMVGELSNYISHEILTQYLTETIRILHIAIANKNMPNEVQTKMIELVKSSSEQTRKIGEKLQLEENFLFKLEQQMSYIRGQASGNLLSNYLSNYDF